MIKVTVTDTVVRVENPPFGNIEFSRESLKGLKKDDFDKLYKGKIDTKEVWKAIKKYTR